MEAGFGETRNTNTYPGLRAAHEETLVQLNHPEETALHEEVLAVETVAYFARDCFVETFNLAKLGITRVGNRVLANRT